MSSTVNLSNPRVLRSLAHLTEAEASTFLDKVSRGAQLASAVLPVLAPVAPAVSLARHAVNAIKKVIKKRRNRKSAAPRTRTDPGRTVAPAGSATILLSGLIQSRSAHQALDRLALGSSGRQPIAAGATHLPARAILSLIHRLSAQALREVGGTTTGDSNLGESLRENRERDECRRASRSLELLRAEEALWSASALQPWRGEG